MLAFNVPHGLLGRRIFRITGCCVTEIRIKHSKGLEKTHHAIFPLYKAEMKKLVIVTQAVDRDDPNLGAFYYWFELLAQQGACITILAGRAGSHNLPANVKVRTFGTDMRFGRIGRLWKFWMLFSRHYANADAVLFHQIPEFVLAAWPFLIGKKGIVSLWYAHGAVSWRLRMAERMVDNIFTSSEAGFRIPSKKVFHLGQAINTEIFHPSSKLQAPSSDLRMISVGRISPVKNYETLIQCGALLNDIWRHPWTLTIVGGPITSGDRAYLKKLQALVQEHKLDGRIHFVGERSYSEIAGMLREHDIFLNASKTGSLDKAVLEAMAVGLTVLTSNEGYRTILPPEYFLEDARADMFAERIQRLADKKRSNIALRDIVVRDHALVPTMERMARLLINRG